MSEAANKSEGVEYSLVTAAHAVCALLDSASSIVAHTEINVARVREPAMYFLKVQKPLDMTIALLAYAHQRNAAAEVIANKAKEMFPLPDMTPRVLNAWCALIAGPGLAVYRALNSDLFAVAAEVQESDHDKPLTTFAAAMAGSPNQEGAPFAQAPGPGTVADWANQPQQQNSGPADASSTDPEKPPAPDNPAAPASPAAAEAADPAQAVTDTQAREGDAPKTNKKNKQ